MPSPPRQNGAPRGTARREAARRHGIDLAKAHRIARAKIAEAAGMSVEDLEAELARESDPIARARRAAELAAPVYVAVLESLGLGTSLEELDDRRGGARLMAEIALRKLGIAGLKTGDVVEHDLSDRMQGFLTRFFGRPDSDRDRRGAVLDTTARALEPADSDAEPAN